VADQQLVSIVDRIVRLMEEKKSLQDDIKDIYAEAKSAGHEVKALRVVVKRRMETADQHAKRKLVEDVVELMEAQLGDFKTSELGKAALRSVA
jgi:uncharacterized protein (UPF0335 family)